MLFTAWHIFAFKTLKETRAFVDRRLEKDIYTRDGKLLLAAGCELTEKIRARLIELGDLSETLSAEDIQHKIVIESSSVRLMQKFKLNNAKTFDLASEIVSQIVFDSNNHGGYM